MTIEPAVLSHLKVAVDELVRLATEEGLVGISVTTDGQKVAVVLGGVPDAPKSHRECPDEMTEAEPEEVLHVVASKFVGLMHRHNARNQEFLVEEGQHVDEGDVIACVESMRIMNEITADATGTLIEFLVQGGEIIEYGQPLVTMRIDA